MTARLLIIAGSDSGGGAGIQADLKTVMALGGFAATAITALTAQNTHGVFGVLPTPAAFVARQVQLVLEDMGADCVKTGMLVNAEIIAALADILPPIPLVIDPVMVSKNGAALLDPQAVAVLTTRLFPRAHLITPNLPEAEALLGRSIGDEESQNQAALDLLAFGCQAVLLKGGHGSGEQAVDILATAYGIERFARPRLNGPAAHGTGCTLASAIATGLAQHLPLPAAVTRARDYVHHAIAGALIVGGGHPVLDHGGFKDRSTPPDSAKISDPH